MEGDSGNGKYEDRCIGRQRKIGDMGGGGRLQRQYKLEELTAGNQRCKRTASRAWKFAGKEGEIPWLVYTIVSETPWCVTVPELSQQPAN